MKMFFNCGWSVKIQRNKNTLLYPALFVLTFFASIPMSQGNEKHHPKAVEKPVLAPLTAGKIDINEQVTNTNVSMLGSSKGKGMGKGMDKMMEKMGAPKPKDLYPSLMRLSALSDDNTKDVLNKATNRMLTGNELMINGFTQLAEADQRQNFAEMQSSVSTIEQGLSQYNSGLAAKRAIVEGQEPRRVALTWFKSQMNLLPTREAPNSTLIFGISPLHSGIMVILLLFSAVMIWMYGFKMRRAAALLKELETSAETSQVDNIINSTLQKNTPENVNSTPSIIRNDISDEKVMQSLVTKKLNFVGDVKVIGIFNETHDVKTFRLAERNGDSLPFTYEPGQFVTFSLSIPNQPKLTKRSYTISSSPTEKDYFEVTIKREQHGLVSRFMHDEVSIGDELTIKAPNGKFYFNGADEDSVVLVSGGVGITPMMSAVRYLTSHCWEGNIYFLFCTRSSNDFIFEKELQYLQSRYKNLHVLVSMTRAEGTSWMGPQGRFTSHLVNDFVPDLPSKVAHICGPPPMMEAMTQLLIQLGMAPDRVKTEAFGSAPPKKKQSDTLQPNSINTKIGFEVSFSKSNKSTIAEQDETVLDVAEKLDIEIDSSCRSGTCGSCKTKLIKGTVEMEVDDGLENEEKNQGYILACQSIPKTALEVDA